MQQRSNNIEETIYTRSRKSAVRGIQRRESRKRARTDEKVYIRSEYLEESKTLSLMNERQEIALKSKIKARQKPRLEIEDFGWLRPTLRR
jgi:hypothetical protein